MQKLGPEISSKHSLVNKDALAEHARRAASNQHVHNIHFACELVSSRMSVEVMYDPSNDNDDVLTSRWHATLAGLPATSFLILELRRTLSAKFLADNSVSPFIHCQDCAGQWLCGANSGKGDTLLSIRNYYTKISMYVTELSSNIHAVLGRSLVQAVLCPC